MCIHQDTHYEIRESILRFLQKEYLKRNVQYQLLELMSQFDEDLLQRAETFNIKSFIHTIKTHFINQYEANCIQDLFVCLFLFVHLFEY